MLNEYVAKIKWAKTDKAIRDILKCFYVESLISKDFREQVENEIEKDEDEDYENN